MSINLRQLKDSLTLDDYEQILNELEIPITSRRGNPWILKSMCHSISPDDCDSNLAFYTDSKTFTCFSHNCLNGGDIFELIQVRQKLFTPDYTFIDSVNFVLDTLNLDSGTFKTKTIRNSWQQIVARYKHDYINTEPTVYDDKVLKGFSRLYYKGWIDEGINIHTMQKYEIAFYPTKNCIVIPCRDKNNNLIGIRGRYFYGDGGKYRPIKLLDGTMYNFPTSMFMYGEHQNQDAIRKYHKVILVEGEKSVLKSDTWYGDDSITLALYGGKLSGEHIKTLIEFGADEVCIGLDYDYHKIGDNKSKIYRQNVLKIADKLRPYFTVTTLYNNKFEGYKYSPFDFTKEQYEYLWENRVKI